MIRRLLAAGLVIAAGAVSAQSITIETIPLPSEDEDGFLVTRPTPGFVQERAEPGEQASGAVLRALDKVSGETTDVEMRSGQSAQIFALDVGLTDCRYPAGNPAGDAFAHLIIRDENTEGPVFTGWMVASSPALSALDHARYDVWVLRCITS